MPLFSGYVVPGRSSPYAAESIFLPILAKDYVVLFLPTSKVYRSPPLSSDIMLTSIIPSTRLPRSYVTWIATLASLDGRVLRALRLLREGHWSYIHGSPSHSHVLRTFSKELGYNPSWGDPHALPAYGGAVANAAWRSLGVKNRAGVGGLPCELVHGGVGSTLGLESSCTANSSLRGLKAFVEAIAIYLPASIFVLESTVSYNDQQAHFIPVLLTRPRTLFQRQHALPTFLGAMRSASFLSVFVASYWYAVCITRSLAFARIFPFISHDFWDGPTGCILAGCMACGSSIWIENGRRRGEMALYVLPRAVRTLLPENWIRRGNRQVKFAERSVFFLLLYFSTYDQQAGICVIIFSSYDSSISPPQGPSRSFTLDASICHQWPQHYVLETKTSGWN